MENIDLTNDFKVLLRKASSGRQGPSEVFEAGHSCPDRTLPRVQEVDQQ